MPSASEESVWMECQRKWSFLYQDGAPRTSTPAQALGTETHAQLEAYYAGVPLSFSGDDLQSKAAPIAQAGLEFLPSAGPPHLLTEQEFLIVSPRHSYYGLIDLLDPKTCTIYDHKTTSNLTYAKTPEKLQTDVQAIIYATHALVEWGTPSVNLQWTYMTTRGKPRAVPVRTTITREHAGTMFALVEDVADEIQAAKGTKTLDLEPNPLSCDNFGGCPFRHICNLGPHERMKAFMGTTSTEDLLARLTRKNSATEVTAGQINPPEAANAHPPAPEPTTPAPEVKADTPAPEVKAEEPVEHKEKRTRKAAPVEAPTQPTAHRKLIGALLVNAIPTFQHRTFEDLLAEANKVLRQTELRDDKGVVQVYQDYRDVPFGRGASVLLACVMQVLQDSKRVENLVISDRHTPEAQIVMNTMLANSDVVVRGV